MKNKAPVPDRTTIAATGSAPPSIAGRARRLPKACAKEVTRPRPIPIHKGFGVRAPSSCFGPMTARAIPATIRPTPAACRSVTVSPRKPKPKASAKGEAVVTWGSQDGAPYVTGVPIGRVDSVYSSLRETTQRAVIEPFVDFSALDVVGVVVPAGTQSDRGLIEGDGSAR